MDTFSGKYKRHDHQWIKTPSGIILPTAKITDLSVRSKSNFLDIKSRALEIEDLYKNSGIQLNSRSGIGQLIKYAKELSDNFLLGKNNNFSDEVFFSAMHLDRIANSILLLENESNKAHFLKRLKSGTKFFSKR